ncbi:MAG: outer membrane lipid asymmetry maintenance protein MlaD [bacterium]
MKKGYTETMVGIFIIVGLICVGYLAIKLGKMGWIGGDHYTLFASFRSVTGLYDGASVVISGVTMGKVESITLDKDNYFAVVKMKIKKEVSLTDDTIASVKTSGLIGDKYISLSPGGSEHILKSGETIIETESPVDLEELISKYVFGKV